MGVDSFLTYFNKRYKEHGGKWKPIGYSAITGAKAKYNSERNKAKAEQNEKTRQEMMESLNEMLSAVFPQEKNA